MKLAVLWTLVFTPGLSQALVEPQAVGPLAAPIALVYRGPGTCVSEKYPEQGCAELAAKAARMAGFTVTFVGPEGVEDSSLMDRASVWIQPGGLAQEQVGVITRNYRKQVKRFVFSGGGYIGFCAGGFLATERFGWADPGGFEGDGFGLLPGYTQYVEDFEEEVLKGNPTRILRTSWLGRTRYVLWSEGPYFDKTTMSAPGVQVVAEYDFHKLWPFQRAMTIRGNYGRGRVYVTGVHPESSDLWRTLSKIYDADGSDEDLAVDMIKWSARSGK